MESRQRWRDLAGLASDLAFETDAEGRLTFLSPDPLLGWPAMVLLGRRPQALLARPGEPDPFSLQAPARDLRTWLSHADGGTSCLSFSVAPLFDAEGGFAGVRGCARDITAEAAEGALHAAAQRRGLALQALLRRVRGAVMAPRILPALLDLLPAAIGCDGVGLVELGADGVLLPESVAPGMPLPASGAALAPGAPLAPHRPIFTWSAAGQSLAIAPQPPPSGTESGRPALLVWRDATERPFDTEEGDLLEALSGLLGLVLGNQRLVAELERQARTEPLTGLLNRRAFLEELARRLDRLHRDGRGGALLFIDVDNLKPLNDGKGHRAGDAVLLAVAGLLREATRPTDLAARVGGDEFAVWLEGADEAKGAGARAAAICAGAASLAVPAPCEEGEEPGPPLRATVSLGCAIAHAAGDRPEPPDSLIARADDAMYAAKRGGRNGWRLAPPPQPGIAP